MPGHHPPSLPTSIPIALPASAGGGHTRRESRLWRGGEPKSDPALHQGVYAERLIASGGRPNLGLRQIFRIGGEPLSPKLPKVLMRMRPAARRNAWGNRGAQQVPFVIRHAVACDDSGGNERETMSAFSRRHWIATAGTDITCETISVTSIAMQGHRAACPVWLCAEKQRVANMVPCTVHGVDCTRSFDRTLVPARTAIDAQDVRHDRSCGKDEPT